MNIIYRLDYLGLMSLAGLFNAILMSEILGKMTYEGDLGNILSNNSFMFKDNLTSSIGVRASCTKCDEWYKPDNTTVPINSGNGVFRIIGVDEELRKMSNKCAPPDCQDGIYMCVTPNDIILLGLYTDISTSKNFPFLFLKCLTNSYFFSIFSSKDESHVF